MPQINLNKTKNFLNKISKKDRIAILHHDDGDGFCSGILYYEFCKKKKAKVKEFPFSIGSSKAQDFDFREYNKIIICDLGPSTIIEILEKIKEKEVLYLDHHPRDTKIPKEIKEYVTVNKGYIPSSRTAGNLTGLKPWLALTGTITDSGDLYKENDKFIRENLKNLGISLEEFKETVSNKITNFLIYYDKKPNKAFKILRKINSIQELKKLEKYSKIVEKEIKDIVEGYEKGKEKLGDINFYYFEPKLSIKPAVSGIITRSSKKGIYLFASPKKGTKKITISARSQNVKTNLAKILKDATKDLKDSGAGGHPQAAGASILAKDLRKFKENIKMLRN